MRKKKLSVASIEDDDEEDDDDVIDAILHMDSSIAVFVIVECPSLEILPTYTLLDDRATFDTRKTWNSYKICSKHPRK